MSSSEKKHDIPDVPEYCRPFDGCGELTWLEDIISKLVRASSVEALNYQRKVDKEVSAAIFMVQEIQFNPTLQHEWCQLPQWTDKKKRPKVGVLSNLLEEVFRFIWAFMQNDQDAYELRYSVVKHFVDKGIPLAEVVGVVRKAGGYVAVRRSMRSSVEHAALSGESLNAVVRDKRRDHEEAVDDKPPIADNKPPISGWLRMNTSSVDDVYEDAQNLLDLEPHDRMPNWRQYDFDDESLVLCEISPVFRAKLFRMDTDELVVRISAAGEDAHGFKRLKIRPVKV